MPFLFFEKKIYMYIDVKTKKQISASHLLCAVEFLGGSESAPVGESGADQRDEPSCEGSHPGRVCR